MTDLSANNEIAILLATYNGGKYLREQLDSIFAQTYTKWHLYIHDDGSIDDTNQIITEYRSRHPDKITIVEGEATGGAKNNFYFLLKNVESPLYMFSDQDDVWLPNKIEIELEAWNNNKDEEIPVLVFTDLKIVNQNLDFISESLWSYYNFETVNIRMQSLILQNVVTGCTMLINKKMRDMMIMYKHIDNVPMHDKWAAMIALQFGKMIRIPIQTILYRQHENNSVGAQVSKGLGYIKKKIASYKKIKAGYEFTRRQVREFCDIFNIKDDSVIVCIYANLNNAFKLRRIYTYVKYGFFANRFSQKIGLLLLG